MGAVSYHRIMRPICLLGWNIAKAELLFMGKAVGAGLGKWGQGIGS